METAALVISIISLLSTSAIAIYEFIEARNINKINLEAETFNILFRNLMLKELPMARAKLMFNEEHKLVGADDVINIIVLMRKNSVYYQYVDCDFYKRIRIKLLEIEDVLQKASDKQYIGEDQTLFFTSLGELIKDLYYLLRCKYQGRKIKKHRK